MMANISIPRAELEEYLEFAQAIACEAGELTARFFRRASTELRMELKADNSPVTRADRDAEQLMRDLIIGRYPDHGIDGEEFPSRNSDSQPRWILDPIDGTLAFIHGIPLYTVLVALVMNGRPVLGVIRNPILGETAAAAHGLGCRYNGAPCQVTSCGSLANARVLTSDIGELLRRAPASSRLLKEARLSRTWADAYGYLLVATGRADIMLDPVMQQWDIAPLYPIIEEAGGAIRDLRGRHSPLGDSAVACSPDLMADVVAMLRD